MNEGGDIERLTDEEANELIRECKPIYPKVRNPLTDKGDFIGIRHMMYLSLSYDHRIIDGSIGASFLSDVAKELEAWDVNRQLKYVVKEWYVE